MKFEICNLKFLAAVAMFALGARAAEVEPFQKECNALISAMGAYSVHANPSEIRQKLEPALAFIAKNADDPAKRKALNGVRVRLLKSYREADDFESGIPVAKQLLADNNLDGAMYLARGIYDRTGDMAAAQAVLAPFDAMTWQQLGGVGTKCAVYACHAQLYALAGDKEGALAYFAKLRADLKADKGGQWYDEQLEKTEAGIYSTFYDYRGECDFYLNRNNKRAAFGVLTRGGNNLADPALAGKLAREIVLEGKNNAGQFAWLFTRDPAFCEANLAKACGATAASTNALANALVNLLASGVVQYANYGVESPAFSMNWKDGIRVWDLYRKLVASTGAPVAYGCSRNAAMCYAGLRRRADAAAAATLGLSNPKLKPEERAELELIVAFLALKGSEAEIAEAAKKAVPAALKDCPEKKRKATIERAGSVAVLLQDDALARGISSYYLKNVHVTPETRTYTVRYTERPVGGVGNWRNVSPKPEESDFTRKFGASNCDFMLTDVATGDRGNATKDGSKARKYPTTLQAVADEWGVHIVLTYYDSRARQFESGELDAGSYENYIAPGDDTPYRCFLVNNRKDDRAFVMNTSYDSPGQRQTDMNDPRTFRSEVAFEDDRIVTYFAFAWDTFADYVPVDGGEWNFESIFWGPTPSAWNGTMSIHGRSSWGRLRFQLGEAARVKILRAQLFKAVNEYKRNRGSLRGGSNDLRLGCIDYWADPVLGDPEFYDARLKPLVEKLDKVAERVKVGMSDADVKEIVENHFTAYHDIRFTVDRLRAEWLKAKKLEEK